MSASPLRWFEIPATDLGRAVQFYNRVLGCEIAASDMMGCKMAMFPGGADVGGAIIQLEAYEPSRQGTLVYLNCGPDLSVALSKVEGAGGQVLMPKTAIGEHGFCAMFLDTEGNRVGLHSTR